MGVFKDDEMRRRCHLRLKAGMPEGSGNAILHVLFFHPFLEAAHLEATTDRLKMGLGWWHGLNDPFRYFQGEARKGF